MGIRVMLWGERACFTDQAFKSERVSYDVMTPAAARGILDSIYWHPGMHWVIDRIHVLSPVRKVSVMLNELKLFGKTHSITEALNAGDISELSRSRRKEAIQRRNFILKDVLYAVDAHFVVDDPSTDLKTLESKIQGIVMNRLRKGQCWQQPYFGIREYTANFALADRLPPCPEELLGIREIGRMHFDFRFRNGRAEPLYFNAVMKDGVIDLTSVEVSKEVGNAAERSRGSL